MRKTILYIAMSLDGYIADENNSVDFLHGEDPKLDNLTSYDNFIKTVDTVIIGYKTYSKIANELSINMWPYENLKSYVITHKKLTSDHNIEFVDSKVCRLIQKLRKQDGKDIFICGGSDIINQLLVEKMIDKFVISVIPTIIGRGLKLFNGNYQKQNLKLLSISSNNSIAELVYQKI